MTHALSNHVLAYLDGRHAQLLKFWLSGGHAPQGATVQDHCDVIYSLKLIGKDGEISDAAIAAFLTLLDGYRLAGWTTDGATNGLNVHNSAYVLACLNVLPGSKTARYERLLEHRSAAPDTLFDAATGMPRYPSKWGHHSWRVSHWLGGIPSILLSLERSGARKAEPFLGTSARVRAAVDQLINPRTGLLKAYRSELAQKAFRLAYGLRHDPVLGDIGGIVHVLWYDHATGRPYIANAALLKTARELFYARQPFMEKYPYCLDFDVVQAVRTAAQQQGESLNAEDRDRARKMLVDIAAYLTEPGPEYSLHKLPGALAAYHECELIAGSGRPTQSCDIIKEAYWL